jgi:transcriptional regulator with XRE-family HTH domain
VKSTPGRRLRDLRLERGLTQVELAVAARVAVGTISFAERDVRHPMPLVRERIARALGVSRTDIWPEDDLEEAS